MSRVKFLDFFAGLVFYLALSLLASFLVELCAF